ncbi:MAG: 4-hydroxy-3-methylbut-2-enyl diphosphate reductase [Parcubacteria group bacterium]
MKIILAEHLGFCTGVRRALEIARNTLKKKRRPVWFLGEIIHNEKVIKEIREKGGKIIVDPKEAKSGTLVIRAHGTRPLPQLDGILIEDATCPLVKRAQDVAKKLLEAGYKVVIIGEKNHPEVKGILGRVKDEAIVIKNERQAKRIAKSLSYKKTGKKLGVLAQTTQSQDNVNEIINVLKKKVKNLKWQNTLCPQVSSRQKELKKIMKITDGVLVIGSKTSANTQRLVDIAKKYDFRFAGNPGNFSLRKKYKKPVWCVNSSKELKNLSFGNISVLGVVSGTSAPDWEIEKIKKFLMTNNLK